MNKDLTIINEEIERIKNMPSTMEKYQRLDSLKYGCLFFIFSV